MATMSKAAVLAIAVAGIAILSDSAHRTWLVWNASASAPTGLYRLRHKTAAIGELVLVDPPPSIALFAAQRHYLPLHVPLIKHLAAQTGDTVCAMGHDVLIDGHYRARRLNFDSAGRSLPHWSGCRRLTSDEVFLLNTEAPGSFDGRYFGPVHATAIAAVLTPLWTR